MIYGYGRVSTKGQAKDGNSLEAQEKLLKEHGAEVIYMNSFTGTKINRPEFNELLELLQEGDTLVVAKLDRFARSVSQASDLITDLIDKGIRVDVCNLGILDNSSMGTLMRNILLSFHYTMNVEHEHVLTDVTKIKEILVNILSNAIKYTPAGGSVM